MKLKLQGGMKMRYKILGDSDRPLVHIQLEMNEKVKIERGAMVYVSDVDLEGKMNSSKKDLGEYWVQLVEVLLVVKVCL